MFFARFLTVFLFYGFGEICSFTEQLLDWIPQNTRKLKTAALELIALFYYYLSYFQFLLPQRIQEQQFF